MFEGEETSKVMIICPFDLLADCRVWSLKSYNHRSNIVCIEKIMYKMNGYSYAVFYRRKDEYL